MGTAADLSIPEMLTAVPVCIVIDHTSCNIAHPPHTLFDFVLTAIAMNQHRYSLMSRFPAISIYIDFKRWVHNYQKL